MILLFFRTFINEQNNEDIDPYSIIEFTTTTTTANTNILPRPSIDASSAGMDDDPEDPYSTIDQDLPSPHPSSITTRIPSSSTSQQQQLIQHYVPRMKHHQDDGTIDPYSTVR